MRVLSGIAHGDRELDGIIADCGRDFRELQAVDGYVIGSQGNFRGTSFFQIHLGSGFINQCRIFCRIGYLKRQRGFRNIARHID